ncbi:hypothetical protein [Gynurincola endophyticus]|uniref:hypothetical protein n=1 Tax=Gynurincola endophyticus TaxID=2479004 RepID=UPI000F8F11CA|nr:hypothetical protein [Gynurincola endophyticus]
MKYNGANAKIYLKFKGGIEDLSKIISKGMILPDFYFETDIEFPHNITGHCEALGFSIWLNKLTDDNIFDYTLSIETNMSLEYSYNNLLCDISPWMVRYVSEICEIEAALM